MLPQEGGGRQGPPYELLALQPERAGSGRPRAHLAGSKVRRSSASYRRPRRRWGTTTPGLALPPAPVSPAGRARYRSRATTVTDPTP